MTDSPEHRPRGMSLFERLRSSHRGDSPPPPDWLPGNAVNPADGDDASGQRAEDDAGPIGGSRTAGVGEAAEDSERYGDSPGPPDKGRTEAETGAEPAAPGAQVDDPSYSETWASSVEIDPPADIDTPPGGVPAVNSPVDGARASAWPPGAGERPAAAGDGAEVFPPWRPASPTGAGEDAPGAAYPGAWSEGPGADSGDAPPESLGGAGGASATQGPTNKPAETASDSDHPAASHPLPRIMAIANQKGGVGKTTTAVNLGAALAELGYRVLVIDLDPQGNATTGLGVNPRNLDNSIYDVVLHDVPVEDCIEPSGLRNLFVVPATIDLAGAEIELVPLFSRELRLRRALDAVKDDFDFILIDCPPSLGLLTVNGLAAASEVVVPI